VTRYRLCIPSRTQEHRAHGGNDPVDGLRPRQSHGCRRAEGHFLFGDEDRRPAHRRIDMLGIFGDML
jgi:hypothetical protein